MTTLLRNSVAPTTQKKYARSWILWREFLRSLAPADMPSSMPDQDFAPTCLAPHLVTRLLTMWVHYLAVDLQKSAEATSGHLSALRFHFRRYFCRTEVFDDPQLAACKRALYLDPAAFHGQRRQAAPVPLELVESILSHFGTPALQKRIIAVATALAFCCLLRPSEYCNTGPDATTARHVIRAEQVLFERRPLAHQHSTFHPAHALPSDFVFTECLSVKIVFLSAKNISLRSSQSVWFSTDTDARLQLPRILFDWAKNANLHSTDHFVSYRTTPVDVTNPLSYARLRKVLQHTARLFGLDPTRFTCHGLRVGGATLLRASGADDGMIMAMGRWRSLPACLGYQAPSTASHDRMLNLLSTPGQFTSRDVRLGQIPSHLRPAVPLPTRNISTDTPTQRQADPTQRRRSAKRSAAVAFE